MDIHELIIRAARGDADAGDMATLEAWRSADPVHEREYQELFSLVKKARRLGQELKSTPPPVEAIIARAEQPIGAGVNGPGGTGHTPYGEQERGQDQTPAPTPRRLPDSSTRSIRHQWRTALLPLAAAAVFVVLALGLTQWGEHFMPAPVAPEPLVAVTTSADQKETVRLDDGTVIHLAGESALEVVDHGDRVDVWLDGRAFVAVRPGSDRPTVIQTPAGEAVVLGTRFEVSSQGDELRLLVVEGRVGLKGSSGEVEVNRGQLSVMRGGTVQSLQSVPEPLELLDWMGGTLVFQETPLSEVAREIRWHYGVKVRLTDDELSSRTLTTVFDGQPLETVMTVICRTVQAECQRKDDRIFLSPAQDAGQSPTQRSPQGSQGAPTTRAAAPPDR